jgi:FtsP/CotA-like multicopper oxidase with cupredoxin domain
MGPAERADILVDFSNVPPGAKIILQNIALTENTEVERQTVGQIMQFTVTDQNGFAPKTLPTELNPTLAGSFPTLQNANKQRTLSLIEATGTNGTIAMYLDGQEYDATISETPELGTTEDWVIANPTISAHPIHLHLVQFQIISRQLFNETAYMSDWTALNGRPPLNHSTVSLPSLTPYLIGEPIPPSASEEGWKDTVVMFSGEVTTIRVRFAQQDGSAFPFDATAAPSYVWHCHLLEHEDNEMMRPYTLSKSTDSTNGVSIEILVIIIVIVVITVAIMVVAWRRNRSKF